MEATFEEAFKIAQERYSYPINYYWEYKDYFVFYYDNGEGHDGGMQTPVVVRKSDLQTLPFAPPFFGIDPEAEDVGDVLAEGTVSPSDMRCSDEK